MSETTNKPLPARADRVLHRDRIANAYTILRRRQKFTIRQVARLVECHPSDISKYENGWKMPTLIRALDLAAALGADVEQLYPEISATRGALVNQRRERLLNGEKRSMGDEQGRRC